MNANRPSSLPVPGDPTAFVRDLQALRAELDASIGAEDIAHLASIERWGRACTALGYATAWLVPNPVSAMLIAQGSTVRWTMVAHHVTHRGYDSVPSMPEHRTSRGFARGVRRFLDWPEWIHPEAWKHEHNHLHHGRTGETVDPDLVEQNAEGLRASTMPMVAKYAIVGLWACTWKLTYYAPNTFLEWRKAEKRRAGTHDDSPVSIAAAWDVRTEDGRAFWRACVLPYALGRFVAVPALFAPLGPIAAFNVLANSVMAEVLANVQTFVLIAPNHAGDDLYRFDDRVDGRADFMLRQITGSVNYATGGNLVDFLHGYLNYQIEHHVFPDLPMRAYRTAQPKLKALCAKHGVPYVQESVFKRVARLVDVMVGRTSMRRTATRANAATGATPSREHVAASVPV